MGVTFEQGQVWEDEDGVQIRIIDEKVSTPTELYLTPVKLQVEPVGSELPDACIEQTVAGGETILRMSRDTMLQEFTRVSPE